MKRLPPIPVFLLYSAATAFLFGLVFNVNLIYQATVVQLSPLQLVLVGTALELSTFLFEVPTGIVADATSRRLSIIIGCSLIGLGFLLEGALPAFAAVLAGQALWGLGYTFTSGATEAWIADEVGEERAGQAFVRGTQAGLFGSLLAIPVSIAIGVFQVNLPIIIGGIAFLALALFLAGFMPEAHFRPTPREERNSWQQMGFLFRQGVRLVRRQPALINLLAIGLFFGLYSEGFDRLWTPHLLQNFTVLGLAAVQPVVWMGALNLIATLLTILASEWLRRKVDPDRPDLAAWTLLVNGLALVGGLLVFALTQSFPLAIAAYGTIYLTRRIIGPYYTTWLNHHLESGVRATVISISSQIDAIGQIASGPILGLIGQSWSIRAALTASGLILSPVLFLLARTVWADRATAVPKENPNAP